MKLRTILLILAPLGLSSAYAGDVPAPAAVSNTPVAPSLSELLRLKSVSQYGITWTFEAPAPVGHFVNGDFYIVGPVTITNIDPRPLVGSEVPAREVAEAEKTRFPSGKYLRNGSMLNPPPAREEVAFDTGIKNYCYPDLVTVPPVRMKPGDCLASTISLKVGEKAEFPYHSEGEREQNENSPIKTLAILTCVANPLPADAFRPSYGNRGQKIFFARKLRRNLLRRLPLPPDAPNLLTWIRVFQRPWFNTCYFGFEQPMENMPHYGQWIAQAQSVGGLILMLDYNLENKERLLINIVQVGIDYWGLVQNGHSWGAWGGHSSGRKFPIVLAGLLLGDDEMASPTKTFPTVQFGEDNQTMCGNGWTGAKALFAGHSGIETGTGKIPRPEWGPYEHLPPSKWSKGNFTSECYRRANTSSAWVGEALVIRMLHAEKDWNHDAFFDYVDRWMTEDDTGPGRIIMQSWPEIGFNDHDKWNREGYAGDPFVKTMWERYRDHLDGMRK